MVHHKVINLGLWCCKITPQLCQYGKGSSDISLCMREAKLLVWLVPAILPVHMITHLMVARAFEPSGRVEPCRLDLLTKGTNSGPTSCLRTYMYVIVCITIWCPPPPPPPHTCLGCQAAPWSGYCTPSVWSACVTGF